MSIKFKSSMAGVTLLEVLIAIVVLSFGLLGLAGLQFANLRSNQVSTYRSIATQQAYDIADRMRANMDGVTSGYYNAELGSAHSECLTPSGCTTQNMAQNDVYMWNEMNGSLLPKGKGIVCIDGTPNDGTPAAPACDNVAGAPYVIKMWWDETRSGSASQRFVTVARLGAS